MDNSIVRKDLNEFCHKNSNLTLENTDFKQRYTILQKEFTKLNVEHEDQVKSLTNSKTWFKGKLKEANDKAHKVTRKFNQKQAELEKPT